MRLVVAIPCVLGLAGFLLAGQGRAEEFGTAGAAQHSPLPSKLNQQIDQAVDGNASSDLQSRIDDLDATRAALDEKKKPTVSLGVSGWVSQQVQYNVK